MSERDLAEAIYAELRTDEALDHAIERWQAHDMLPLRIRLGLALDAVTASAIDRVLARRQREAARTGPWDTDPSGRKGNDRQQGETPCTGPWDEREAPP